jgi:stearoyl-CoA desaturase (Delta-9 desaturase)
MQHLILRKIAITIAVIGPIVGLLVAVYLLWNRYVFTSDIVLLLGMYVITALGVTIGYHRMLTHQGFDCPQWLRGLFIVMGAMATMGSKPVNWAATHVKHHAHSDEEDDPHSPLKSMFYAHIGWMYDIESHGDPAVYTPQLLQDKTVMFVNRHMWLWALLSFGIPFAIGGWTGLLWGGVVRFFFSTHVMWSVNSICHTFGKRDFETTDESRNEWVVGLLAFGEGWHNNHHAFPQSAFHGLKWYQFDLSGIIIGFMERLGLVWNVQRVSQETMEAHKLRTQKTAVQQADLRTQLQETLHNADRELQIFFSSLINSSVTNVETEKVHLEKMHADAVRRIRRIQKFVTKANHMKRQKLMAYGAEVQQIVGRMREEAQKLKALPA